MDTPKISVIVPIYKAEKYLNKCIDSILAQIFTDFELLLIDDGSPDNSGKICDGYAEKDSRIRVFHKENGGVSSARNMGLDNARGEWIAFVDADDYYFDHSLHSLIEAVNTIPCDVVLACAYRLENLKLTPIYKIKETESNNICDLYNHYALWGYLFNNQIITKYAIRFVDGLAYSEDLLFIVEYVSHCTYIKQIKDFVYVYRINESSACHSNNWHRTALHQFWSASLLKNFVDNYRGDRTFFSMVKKQIRGKVISGLSCFVVSKERLHYKKVQNLFYRYFKENEYCKLVFFFDYIQLICKFYIKKLINRPV